MKNNNIKYLIKLAQNFETKINAEAPSIAVNDFVKRQIPKSKFSHFEGSWEELISLVKENFSKAKQGYRSGVLLVPVPADRFMSGVVQVTPETQLHAVYSARKEGEDPYVQILSKGGKKSPAKYVEIVLYSHDALAETNEFSTDADYEIISINARPTDEDEPMPPITMARNYLSLPGGTKADYTAKQFAESMIYWSTRAMIHEED
jgi:hypothetical protein